MENGYVGWEEVNVGSEKGGKEINFYMKRKNGKLDLFLIGKERSVRHMSYHYVISNVRKYLSPSFPLSKLQSKREVVDWLNSILSSDINPLQSPNLSGSLNSSDDSELDIQKFKGSLQRKLGHHTKEFLWLGSPWTCKKKRKHYPSFRRNSVKISVNDFVYVLAEENKRLVAYLEDMYEDYKGNKMVVARWYHKIDEVGIALPRNFNDREIFSSLCLQDLSVECIDGMATVLSPQHFDKFRGEAKLAMFDPFVCDKQFEDDNVRPFDITQVKGYWKQEILRYLHPASVVDQVNSRQLDDGLKQEMDTNGGDLGIRPKKRLRRLKEDAYADEQSMDVDMHSLNGKLVDCKIQTENCCLAGGKLASPLSVTEAKQNPLQLLKVGSEVELLSQDSGIRGCWFRALIIKIQKTKVKVRYQDIKDADNEANNLEEWILATRVAIPDLLGNRFSGRPIIRPSPKQNRGKVSWDFNTGTAVDVWWRDVWQEGIIVHKESEDRFHVYFPGEKQESVFFRGDMRHSLEWFGNEWMNIKDSPDVITSISSKLGEQAKAEESKPTIPETLEQSKTGYANGFSDSGSDDVGELKKMVHDLSKDNCLVRLRWNASKKRRPRRCVSSSGMHKKNSGIKSTKFIFKSRGNERFVISVSHKLDHENCKYTRDSLFMTGVAQPLTSLVMSR